MLLVVTDRPEVARALRDRISPGWASLIVTDTGAAAEAAGADMVLMDVPPRDAAAIERALAMARRLRETAISVLAVGEELSRPERVALYRAGVLACISPEKHADELSARLQSLLGARLPAALAMKRLREHTRTLDEQVRLARRLQMDFLPRRLPRLDAAMFAARLEAASWVAGDFYDVFRLDERHVGFYVADAVGHGIPAALLTVFVKKSLPTKRVEGHRYELIPPEEALRLLNADLVSAELQESPFITMVYGLYNTETREVTYARAGHPRPLLLKADGALLRLPGEGPLLGVFRDAAFERSSRQLEPGERLILYSDGADRVDAGALPNTQRFLEVIQASALLPLEAMLDAMLEAVRAAAVGGRLADDVTLLALEREGE